MKVTGRNLFWKIVMSTIIPVLISLTSCGQGKPFIGYDKVAWGVSVNKVRQTYSIGEDVKLISVDNDPNIAILVQENISDSIRCRLFVLNNDKLYRVIVGYNDNVRPDDTVRLLKTQLEQRFGKATDSDNGDIIAQFEQYAPDIEVHLQWANLSLYINDTKPYISVWYTWKKFRDEYLSSKLGS
jgi:hypothetical protein